jgi:phthalate 4,5-dioxygenase oxygenase subunit
VEATDYGFHCAAIRRPICDPETHVYIADRSADHLGFSDIAIVQFRRQMVAAAKAASAGELVIGAASASRPVDLASFEGVVPKTSDWRGFTTRHAYVAAAE